MTAIVSNEGPSPANRDGLSAGLANKLVSAANGIDYAYRDTGPGASGGLPLVLLQHFRGNLDNWDPALIDALASTRRVIAFDNSGPSGRHRLRRAAARSTSPAPPAGAWTVRWTA